MRGSIPGVNAFSAACKAGLLEDASGARWADTQSSPEDKQDSCPEPPKARCLRRSARRGLQIGAASFGSALLLATAHRLECRKRGRNAARRTTRSHSFDNALT